MKNDYYSGSKRVRKQAKFLANFILYATNKESDIEDKVIEIQNRAKILHDMVEKKNEILQAINDKALHIAKQLSIKEKVLLLVNSVCIYIMNYLYHIDLFLFSLLLKFKSYSLNVRRIIKNKLN